MSMRRCATRAAVAAGIIATGAAADNCGHDDPVLQADIQAAYSAAVNRHNEARRAAEVTGRAFKPATGSPEPIRIRFFTEDLNDDSKFCLNGKHAAVGDFQGKMIPCEPKGKNDLTAAKKSYLIDKLLPEAASRLATLLSVVRRSGNLHVNSCGPAQAQMTVPTSHATGKAGVGDADFVIYVGAAPATAAAWAGSCAFHTDDMQPFAGRANFDPSSLDPKRSVDAAVVLAVHEIMHALGFSKSFFGNTPHPQTRVPLKTVTNRRGLDFVTVLAGPASIREARRFYDCDDLEGIELENEGGSGSRGSHMERRVAKDELMGPVGGPGISRMTLAVFEDLGFYSPNYDALETDPRFSGHQPQFGRGRGCGFVREKCNTVAGGKDREFCFQQKTDPTCAPNHMGMGTCNVNEFTKALPPAFQYFDDPKRGGGGYMDGCPVFNNWNDCSVNSNGFPGTISENSRCVLGVNYGSAEGFHPGTMPRCQRTKCVNGELHMVGKSGASVICLAVGDKVTPPGHMGQLICPDPAVICPPSAKSPTTPTPTPKPEMPAPTATPAASTPVPIARVSFPTQTPPTTLSPQMITGEPSLPGATVSGLATGGSNAARFDSGSGENASNRGLAGAALVSGGVSCFAAMAKVVLVLALSFATSGVQ